MTGWDNEEEEIRRRLEALIREKPGFSLASLSEAIGKNRAYLQQYLRRGQPRRLHHRDRATLASLLDVHPSELGIAPEPHPGFAESVQDGILFVPLQEGDSGRREPHKAYPFLKSHIESLGVTPERLIVCRVDGDAMMPTLADGDLALVDRSFVRGQREGLYLIVAGGMRMVRRISANPLTGRLRISCDNPLVDDRCECTADQLSIVGRIVWAGRKI